MSLPLVGTNTGRVMVVKDEHPDMVIFPLLTREGQEMEAMDDEFCIVKFVMAMTVAREGNDMDAKALQFCITKVLPP